MDNTTPALYSLQMDVNGGVRGQMSFKTLCSQKRPQRRRAREERGDGMRNYTESDVHMYCTLDICTALQPVIVSSCSQLSFALKRQIKSVISSTPNCLLHFPQSTMLLLSRGASSDLTRAFYWWRTTTPEEVSTPAPSGREFSLIPANHSGGRQESNPDVPLLH